MAVASHPATHFLRGLDALQHPANFLCRGFTDSIVILVGAGFHRRRLARSLFMDHVFLEKHFANFDYKTPPFLTLPATESRELLPPGTYRRRDIDRILYIVPPIGVIKPELACIAQDRTIPEGPLSPSMWIQHRHHARDERRADAVSLKTLHGILEGLQHPPHFSGVLPLVVGYGDAWPL